VFTLQYDVSVVLYKTQLSDNTPACYLLKCLHQDQTTVTATPSDPTRTHPFTCHWTVCGTRKGKRNTAGSRFTTIHRYDTHLRATGRYAARARGKEIQQGLVLRRFVLRRFTFTTPIYVPLDRMGHAQEGKKYSRVSFLRRFVLRFTFTTLVESDRAHPTCGASLSQLECPFCTQCASSSFPVCMCLCLFYSSAVLLS
jgi:hypothetical protein